MCFRPASVSKPIECPNCKKKVPVVGTTRLKSCPFCKAPLPTKDETTETPENK
ncbi:hypothetical protein DESME_00725 [Desulfitobacterium metallireducens DSM 15288]|uniref:Uncharacterized protein n=1 Tax=Desulfitobacterium metallireducens DSM 15288 TaxID=871968 RepID=W0E4K7_9FIRM|nr:hypothetical protein DESME_00725 [Desulfitobacterium metallireducens DSM 15288]